MCKRVFFTVLTVFLSLLFTGGAFAQDTGLNDIAYNMTESVAWVPGLIAGLAYLTGLVLGVAGVIKIKEHVENPQNAPFKQAAVRLLAGGAFFALPAIYNAMQSSVSGPFGFIFSFFSTFDPSPLSEEMVADLNAGTTIEGLSADTGINHIMENLIFGIEELPGIISAVAYLLALLLGFSAISKLKEHVENPEQVKISEGVVRLLIGGALFSLPTVLEAMFTAITGTFTGGLGGALSAIFGEGTFTGAEANQCDLEGTTLGTAICHVVAAASGAPSFFNAIAYLFGLVLCVWGLLKVRDHVLDPRQVQIWEGVSRLVAGGAFFALPFVIESLAVTVALEGQDLIHTAYNEIDKECSSSTVGGLDTALYCLMKDIARPVETIVYFFALIAGIVFIMIGISRLMKSAQEGAKGPGGLGTVMTFLTGAVLISSNTILAAASQSLFADNNLLTYAELGYSEGLDGSEASHVTTVISAVLKFMFLVGLISFVRGWFILRDVAEGGNQQASAMAGITHIVGGAVAVNLGPLLNALQATLGITGVGVTFS